MQNWILSIFIRIQETHFLGLLFNRMIKFASAIKIALMFTSKLPRKLTNV